MKNINALKSLLSIILLIVTIFASMPLCATTTNDIPISDAEHKQIIEQFLNEISVIQNQVADIALSTLKNSSSENMQLQIRINLIDNNIVRLNKRIQDYLATIPDVSDRNRHVLLTFNVLNLIKDSLYSLSLIVKSSTDMEKFALLDAYFRSRLTALDTIELLKELLTKSNT